MCVAERLLWTGVAVVPALLLFGKAAWGDSGSGAVAELHFRVESSTELPLSNAHFALAQVAPNQEFFFMAADLWTMHRLYPGGAVASFSLDAVAEAAAGDVQLSRSFAVDRQGRVHLLGVWREPKPGAPAKSGVFVFDGLGRNAETIVLSRQMDPQQLALDEAGNLIVLGFDGEFIRGRTPECRLLHRFSRGGVHMGSFSACPQDLVPPSLSPAEHRSAFLRLRRETEEDLLWVRQGRVYHVLSGLRRLRIFTEDGAPLREIPFLPPDSRRLLAEGGMRADPANDRIRGLVQSPDGRRLVEWAHGENVGTSGRRQTTFLALHDSEGRPLSRAAHPAPSRPSVPLDCDADGRVLFLHLARDGGEKVVLVRASVTLR